VYIIGNYVFVLGTRAYTIGNYVFALSARAYAIGNYSLNVQVLHTYLNCILRFTVVGIIYM